MSVPDPAGYLGFTEMQVRRGISATLGLAAEVGALPGEVKVAVRLSDAHDPEHQSTASALTAPFEAASRLLSRTLYGYSALTRVQTAVLTAKGE